MGRAVVIDHDVLYQGMSDHAGWFEGGRLRQGSTIGRRWGSRCRDGLRGERLHHYTEVIVRALRDLTGVVFAVAIAVDPTQEQRKSCGSIPR